jgi:uncharacterized protein (TIGR02594 family)
LNVAHPLPKHYEWLLNEPGPKILQVALPLHGTKEVIGRENNPVILAWAAEVGLDKVYKSDETPWCGLWVALCVKRAGKPVVKDPLWARNWAKWGVACEPELGCILVFERGPTSGHVGIYIGEDDTFYYVYGGNQKDMVSIVPIRKERLIASRCLYSVAKPANVRAIRLASDGSEASRNEA